MAIFKFGPTNSGATSVSGSLFSAGLPGPNSLIIDPGGFLITTGFPAVAADLNAFGPWTVTVNGSILATDGTGIRLNGLLSDFDPTAPPASTITIGKDGSVQGSGNALQLSRPATVNNSGSIVASLNAIVMIGQGALKINNSGFIDGDIFNTGSGVATLSNSNFIDGNVSLGTANDVVSNKGSISGFVHLNGGNNKLTNTGAIKEVTAGSGNDTILNSGGINSPLQLGEGNNTLTNGTLAIIFGNVTAGAGNDTMTNSGFIDGSVFTGDGNDVLTNSGTITLGINFGQGVNKFTNSGTVEGSDVAFGVEADTMTNTGIITVSVNLGGGSNALTNSKTISGSIIGGPNSDKVSNGGTIGTDVLLADGDDTYTATGNGQVFGKVVDGGGNDTYTFGVRGGTFKAIGTNSSAGTGPLGRRAGAPGNALRGNGSSRSRRGVACESEIGEDGCVPVDGQSGSKINRIPARLAEIAV